MKDPIYSFADFSLEALLSLSESHRGLPCTCDVSRPPKSGCLNWVIFIMFDDGVEWVFRSPRDDILDFVSADTASKILLSEVSTLRYLKNHTSIPVPEVYAFSGSYENDIGVPYILQSKAAGRSLGSYDWSPDPHYPDGNPLLPPRLPISDTGREKVMEQLGAIMAQLSEHRFDKIGSLMSTDTEVPSVGECLSPTFTWQERDKLESLQRGPFDQEMDYLRAQISALESHIQELQMMPHIFIAPIPEKGDFKTVDSYAVATTRWNDFVTLGQKVYSSENALSYLIAGQFLREMLPLLSSAAADGFMLSHPDLHLGNIFVDNELTVSCIIDWSSTTTGPITELLVPPSLGTSRTVPSGPLASAFQAGFAQRASSLGKEIPQSDLWKKSEALWYFSRMVRLLSRNDMTHFTKLYGIVHRTDQGCQDPKDILLLFSQRASQEENKKLIAELKQGDMSEEEIRDQEQAYFVPHSIANSDTIAVARKLTLMSEMNPQFLADHRLWQWVEEARKGDS